MSILAVDNLEVSARIGTARIPVVSGLGFTLQRGSVLGVVGESGAGKSMIGRAIAQILPQGFSVTGGLSFLGQDLIGMPAEQRRMLLGRDIAFVPQEPLSGLNPVLTIGAQIDEHLARLGIGAKRARRDYALDMLNAVRLPRPADILGKYAHQLSGGMCQRVLIAMAFASRPKLLIADEPTTALDVTTQSRIVELIRDLQRSEGTSVIFITHDLRLAADISDQVLVLYAGRLAEYGPAKEIFADAAHPYTRCLQLSNPSVHASRIGLYSLPDRMPGISALGSIAGCLFGPRCPNVIDACREKTPRAVSVGEGHDVACIRSDLTARIDPPLRQAIDKKPYGASLLTVESVSKTFSMTSGIFRRTNFQAVRNINFTLQQNEFVGIVGESGSGKSTVARLLCGLETATEGKLVLAGRDVTGGDKVSRQHQRAHIQMVFQDPQSALNPRRSVASIITQAMEAAGQATWRDRLAKAEALLHEVGLPSDAALRFPSELSGGQKQRVNIARALCRAPEILVADEIVSGLDVSVQAQLLNLLLRLRSERSFSMVLISHDLAVVRYLCDRVFVMHKGEFVEAGPTADVFDHPQHPYTESLLAAVPRDFVADAARRDRRNGISPADEIV
ncbi:MAG: ABC transporter ATP-binding protein [Rhizobiales bacterium]|nr:ABC transporter ATP-binding protein [Hyphomicrobiales bacterium]OJY41912.1 MAG: ABC transporter ATP-binding protein [Rhizobiales bacterium 64-17]